MSEYNGYAGKLLRINLTEERVKEEDLRGELAEKYIGGRGLGAKILWDELRPKVDPLSLDNKLLFMIGPLTGTLVPTSGRFTVVAKSPLTGIYGISTCGGRNFGPNLKFAGYDGLIFEGRAKKPTYIYINDEKVEFRDAQHLWGMPTDKTQSFIMQELGLKTGIACIGPAGENLVKFSCVVSETRTASRCGTGAVMGSKNLKAIAVRGTKRPTISNPEKLKKIVRDITKTMAMTGGPLEGYSQFGTSQLVSIVNEYGGFPTRNFRKGTFEHAEQLSGTAMKSMVVKNYACWTCPVHCGKWTVVRSGPYAGTVVEGPEYETISMFGGDCGVNSIEAIAAANKLCDDFGLDTLSTASVIAFIMECYEGGLVNEKETDGLKPKFGDHKVAIELVRRIAFREGLGDLLAEGIRKCAEEIGKGAEKLAIHSKGLEIPAYDPRAAPGAGLNYATASPGGHVNRGSTFFSEVRSGLTRFDYRSKGRLVKESQDQRVIYDCAVLCQLTTRVVTHEYLGEMLNAVTGMDFTKKDFMIIGERINNLERAFNVREGITREDDTLPWRFTNEPMPEGPAKGHVVKLEPMLTEYYGVRGWNKVTGIPKKATLEELGLKDVADQLYPSVRRHA